MSNQVKGKVVHFLEAIEGNGKKGPWKKQEFIVETLAQYPRKVVISAFNKDLSDLSVGDFITADVDLESHEYNERWYSEIRLWKFVKTATAVEPTGKQANPRNAGDERDDNGNDYKAASGSGDDSGSLPF